MRKKIVIGTRGSKLALWQANWVSGKLKEWYPDMEVTLDVIKTQGDKILDVPLAKVGGKGLFVKEIETALIEKKADIAVHSMKDVPAELPDELDIVAITKREDPRDALISRDGKALVQLGDNTVIGTSSLRRKVQLKFVNPSFDIKDLRGNLDTRIRKLDEGQYDAIIVAAAGMNRLGFSDRITELLNEDTFLPAVAQGALGIETRLDDEELLSIAKRFNHPETCATVSAERAFLKKLEGGCQVPIACFGKFVEGKASHITLDGLVGSIDGKVIIRKTDSDSVENASELGVRLAETLIALGAGDILKEVYE